MSCAALSDRRGLGGQAFEEGDYRLVRFTERSKQVNPQFAIDLIAQVPPKVCHGRVVSCDGGGGALGHPKVFINLVSWGCLGDSGVSRDGLRRVVCYFAPPLPSALSVFGVYRDSALLVPLY